MLGWEVFVYRHDEPTEGNLIARWKSSSVGVDWIDLLVKEGKACDLGGSGYPCIYTATASAFLPEIASDLLKKKFPPPSLSRNAIFPNDFSGIVWNKQNLLKCEPEEELLIYLYDQS